MNPTSALTWRASGIARAIISEVGVSLPFIGTQATTIETFKGVWDTGASGSAISASIISKLNLKPTGKILVNTANGQRLTDTYLINVAFPNNLTIQNVTVNEANLGSEVDMLIGMDIITLGDFSVTHANGNTTMSFQVPSCLDVDFVQRLRDRDISKRSPAKKKRRK